MATFRTYEEVLRPDHVQVKAYEAGLTCGPPGLVLADILQRTGGVYETTTPLGFAGASAPPGPQTRIVIGARLDYICWRRGELDPDMLCMNRRLLPSIIRASICLV